MNVYRLAKQEYADDLSGAGAELTGGRWNFKGTRVLYTSDSRALCTAEIAVHMPIGVIPKDYYLITIELPKEVSLERLDINSLPKSWRNFPYSEDTQKIGENFISKANTLVLQVPSAVVPGDFNFLINPAHKDFELIRIKKKDRFSFDDRLFIKNF